MAATSASRSNGPPRTFRAPDGVAWTIREHAVDHGAGGAPCLIFECEGVIRRVRNFPPNWRELSDDALHDLSWSR